MKTTEYHSLWEKREEEEKRKRVLAIEKAREVAKILKGKYKVKEVILFGSLGVSITGVTSSYVIIFLTSLRKRV